MPKCIIKDKICMNVRSMCVLFPDLVFVVNVIHKDLESQVNIMASICGIDLGIWQSCSVNALDESKETPQLQGVPPGLKVILSTHVCSHSSYLDLQRIRPLKFA